MRADDASDRIERPLNQSHLPPTTIETDRGEKKYWLVDAMTWKKKNGGKKDGERGCKPRPQAANCWRNIDPVNVSLRTRALLEPRGAHISLFLPGCDHTRTFPADWQCYFYIIFLFSHQSPQSWIQIIIINCVILVRHQHRGSWRSRKDATINETYQNNNEKLPIGRSFWRLQSDLDATIRAQSWRARHGKDPARVRAREGKSAKRKTPSVQSSCRTTRGFPQKDVTHLSFLSFFSFCFSCASPDSLARGATERKRTNSVSFPPSATWRLFSCSDFVGLSAAAGLWDKDFFFFSLVAFIQLLLYRKGSCGLLS